MGTVGSGKSSLVSATLGEMEKLSGQVNVNVCIHFTPISYDCNCIFFFLNFPLFHSEIQIWHHLTPGKC